MKHSISLRSVGRAFACRILLLCLGLALVPSHGVWAQAPSQAKAQALPTTVLPQSSFLYRTQTGDTLRKIAYLLLLQPSETATLNALLTANNWVNAAPSKAGFVFELNTPVHIPTAMMMHAPATARLLQVTGDVALTQPDQTTAPALSHATVSEGARLILGATGRALVVFPDESRMDVQAGSSVTFSQLRRYAHTSIFMIDVRLEQGRLEAAVNPKRDIAGRFNVQSRRTVTGVRGTVFRIGDAADKPAVVEVLKGEVAFSAAGASVAVPSGQGSFLEASGKPALPVPLLPAPTWLAGSQSSVAAPRNPASPLPMVLPEGTMSVIFELTGADTGATTRSIELKASDALVFPADTPPGSYSFIAKAVDANGLQGLALPSELQLLAPPSPPFPPTVLRLSQDKTQLEWNSAEQALLYFVEIFPATTAQNSAPVYALKTPHHFLPLARLPQGIYRARITTIALQAAPNASAAAPTEIMGSASTWFAFEHK